MSRYLNVCKQNAFLAEQHDRIVDKLGFAKMLYNSKNCNPDPYWECGSGSVSRSTEIYQHLQINLDSAFHKKPFCTFVGM
jgi:hypothetical protein